MFYDEIVTKMSVDKEQLEKVAFVQSNATSNEYPTTEKEFFEDKAMSIVNQSLICGFKNAESNVEDLNTPLYEKYFAV